MKATKCFHLSYFAVGRVLNKVVLDQHTCDNITAAVRLIGSLSIYWWWPGSGRGRPGGARGAAGAGRGAAGGGREGPGLARLGSGWGAPRELVWPPRAALWRAFFGLKRMLKSSLGARESSGRVNKNSDLPISRGF